MFILSACSKPEVLEVSTRPVDRPTLSLPDADEINIRDVRWFILTEENFSDKMKELKDTGRPVAFFALDGEGYENLSLNLSDLRAYIQQQQAIIGAYQDYYENAERALQGALKVSK